MVILKTVHNLFNFLYTSVYKEIKQHLVSTSVLTVNTLHIFEEPLEKLSFLNIISKNDKTVTLEIFDFNIILQHPVFF